MGSGDVCCVWASAAERCSVYSCAVMVLALHANEENRVLMRVWLWSMPHPASGATMRPKKPHAQVVLTALHGFPNACMPPCFAKANQGEYYSVRDHRGVRHSLAQSCTCRSLMPASNFLRQSSAKPLSAASFCCTLLPPKLKHCFLSPNFRRMPMLLDLS